MGVMKDNITTTDAMLIRNSTGFQLLLNPFISDERKVRAAYHRSDNTDVQIKTHCHY